MKFGGVDWTGLSVHDLERVAAFYAGVLGMPETGRGPGYVDFDAGNGALFEIIAAPAESPEVTGWPQQHSWDVSFSIDDVDAAIDHLVAQGVYPLVKHIGRWREKRWVRLRDPEGNSFALSEQRPQRVPSKAELLEKLRASDEEAVSRIRATPPERFGEIVTSEGWTGQQALASIAGVERGPARLIDIERDRQAGAPERPRPRGTAHEYMKRQLHIRQGAPVDALLEEFQTNRAATIAAVEGADEALLGATIEIPITAPLGAVIYSLSIEQMLGYVGEITRADYLSWRLRRNEA